MMRKPESANAVRFGVFEVDLVSGELRKHGVRISLQDQPFQILALLLERPGQVVRREELRRRLWPDGTFVDFEHGLNAAIKRLRSALGDSADTPRFVETLHRRGYRFIAPVASPGRSPSPGLRSPSPREGDRVGVRGENIKIRLAVLPFDNLSRDPEQEYFSDGLTEEMIGQLGRLDPGRLGVIARTSASSFKGRTRTVDEIGRALGVDYLVEGSVRRSGDRVRITARLIDVRDQTYLWSDTYEQRLADYFVLQSAVAGRIARSLAVELLPETGATMARGLTGNVEAHQAYLKGRFHWNTATVEGNRRAVEYYERALHLDPRFARAHAALARAKVELVEYSEHPASQLLEEARRSAERALELDPAEAWGHLARASVRMRLEWDWPGAEAAYRAAVTINPNCEAGHRGYAEFLASMNRPTDALAEIAHALDLDPLCLTINSSEAWILYVARRYDAAIARCQHTLELNPEFSLARRILGAALVATGEYQAAVTELERAAETERREPVELACLAHGLAAAGRRSDALGLLSELQHLSTRRHVSAYRIALVYAGLGDRDAAFAALDHACEERSIGLVNVGVDPGGDGLRSDPRYQQLLHRLRLGDGVRDHRRT